MTTPRHDPIAVIGLGKIGLALAGFYLDRGFEVVGCDIDPVRLRDLAGSPTALAEPGLADALRRGEGERRLRTTSDAAVAAGEARTVVVIVPVHATSSSEIDERALEDVARRVLPVLRPGALLIVETTVPVGTTRRLFCAPLEARPGSGVHVAFSPERVSVGRIFRDLRVYPKVVGGADDVSAERAAAFYRAALDGAEVRVVGSLETAEFVKLIETTYRYVNIALADEFALAAEGHGVDITVAIEAANSQPYSHIHSPGVGVGGNCIPVYPLFFEAGSPSATLPRISRQVDKGMIEHVVRLLRSALGSLSGRRVLLIGVAYRPGVKDSANTPAVPLARRLHALGASVSAVDPLFSSSELKALGLAPGDAEAEQDALVVVTPHHDLLDGRLLRATRARVLIDGRNAVRPESVTALGVRYAGIGRPPTG